MDSGHLPSTRFTRPLNAFCDCCWPSFQLRPYPSSVASTTTRSYWTQKILMRHELRPLRLDHSLDSAVVATRLCLRNAEQPGQISSHSRAQGAEPWAEVGWLHVLFRPDMVAAHSSVCPRLFHSVRTALVQPKSFTSVAACRRHKESKSSQNCVSTLSSFRWFRYRV